MDGNQTHTHPEIPEVKTPIPHSRDWTQPNRRTRPDQAETIYIPAPTYGYGATRRSRFAFGRITAAQNRTNIRLTTNEENTTIETIQTNNLEAQEHIETNTNIEHEITEHEMEETEQFEEDPFQFDEEPSKENCA